MKKIRVSKNLIQRFEEETLRIPDEDDLEIRYSGAIKLVIVYSNDHPLVHYECNRKVPETDPCSREPRGRGS